MANGYGNWTVPAQQQPAYQDREDFLRRFQASMGALPAGYEPTPVGRRPEGGWGSGAWARNGMPQAATGVMPATAMAPMAATPNVGPTLMQTGNATTAAWVQEFPFPVRYLGSKASGSNSNETTLTVAGGAVDAAAQIGDSGDPNWLEPTTSPDYVAVDTACTFTVTQSGSRADDPLIVSVWATGEG